MRRFLLLFVLLCFGTYLSAQTLSARFAVDSAEMCYPQRTVHFTDQSTGQIVSWNWFFGDGTSSTEQNPTHIYSGRGKYVVSLVVTDINGHIDSTTAAGSSVAINIYPFIDFGIPHNYVACSELKLSNQAYSHMTGSFPVQLLWSTGSSANTISADSTGKYILYQQQCGTYISDSVYVIKPAHVLTIGDPLLVSYNLNTDSVLIDWGALYPFPKGTKYDIDWGAGVTADTLKQTNYIWYKGIMGKTLSVSFKATLPAGWGTQCGTIVTATRKVENARMSFDDWNGQNITMNYGDTLRTGNWGYLYNWTLPDGTINADTTGYLVVTQSGKYTLSLSYLHQSITETVNVNVIGQLSPVFNYSHVNCDPLTISCTYTGNADSIVAYKWSVNGRYASMDRNPVLKIDSGLNVIGLIIANASGDSAVMRKTISSEGAWKLKIAIDSIYPCSFRAYLRTTTNAPEGKYSVSWEKGTSYAYDMNMAIADSSGIYIANLKDSCGNIRATDTLNLFLDRIIRPIIAKVGDSIKVSNIMADITYKWYRNDTLVGTGTVAPYPAKSGIYSAYAYRNDSCFRQSWPLTYIAPGEGFSYGISRLPSACGLNAIDFTVTPYLPYGDSIVSYLWVAGKDTSRTNRLTVVKKEWGTVNPVLTMISNYGLTKTITDSYTFPDLTFKVTRLAYNTCHDTARLLANVSTINAYQVVWDGKYVGNPYRPTTSGMHYAVLQDTCGNSYLQDSALVTLFPYTAALALNATKDTIHSTPDDSTAYTYQWYRDGVLLQNESRSYLTSLVKGASYVAALSDTAGCMKSSAALVYNGGTKLRASFTAVPSKCDSSVFQFYGSYDNLTPGDSVVSFYYQFDPSGGGTTQNSFNVFLRGKGIYPVTYSIRTLKGDTASQTQYLLVPDVDRTPWPVEIKVERDSSFPCNDYKILTASTTESKAYYFKWSTDEFRNSIEVQKSGTYNVVVYDSCSVIRGVAQIDINVLEPFNPSITYISGNPDTLMAAVPPANITYEWTRDNTVLKDTGNYILPVGSGTYRVRAFNEKGCITGNASFQYTDSIHHAARLTYTMSSCDSATYYISGDMENLSAGETIVSKTFDYRDGTTATEDGWHTFTTKGNFEMTYTAVTSSGNSYTTVKALYNYRLPVSVSLSLHRGTQDTIFARPDYRDPSFFTLEWSKDSVTIPGKGWFIIPSGAGKYEVFVKPKYGCTYSKYLNYTPEPAKAEVTTPAANASQLNLSADFGNTTFNADNEFTIQLQVKDPNGRTIYATEAVNLGTIKGTDPANLSVAIPATLACASNYTVRVISSSPADTTSWSGTFAITNQPAQPVITQVGDSLFTSSVYDLQWYKDNVAISGATSDAIRARANGAYKVAALNGEGCSSLSDARAVVITAISNVSLGSNTVSAFPNPSEGQVYLKFGYPLTQQMLVKVYNAQGIVVYTIKTSQQQQLLELSTLPKGFYLVEVSGYNTKKVLTIILQ